MLLKNTFSSCNFIILCAFVDFAVQFVLHDKGANDMHISNYVCFKVYLAVYHYFEIFFQHVNKHDTSE